MEIAPYLVLLPHEERDLAALCTIEPDPTRIRLHVIPDRLTWCGPDQVEVREILPCVSRSAACLGGYSVPFWMQVPGTTLFLVVMRLEGKSPYGVLILREECRQHDVVVGLLQELSPLRNVFFRNLSFSIKQMKRWERQIAALYRLVRRDEPIPSPYREALTNMRKRRVLLQQLRDKFAGCRE
jgi:hypothetical protein